MRRLKNATILKGEWVAFKDREKYPFYGEVDDRKYLFWIFPRRMPRNAARNSSFPRIIGTIETNAEGNSLILFQLDREWFKLFRVFHIVWGFIVAAFCICYLIAEPLTGVVWTLGCLCMWRLVLFLYRLYLRYGCKCIYEWLKELWDAESVSEVSERQ